MIVTSLLRAGAVAALMATGPVLAADRSPDEEPVPAIRASIDTLKLADLVATESGDLIALMTKCDPDDPGPRQSTLEATDVVLDEIGDDAPVLRNYLAARASQQPQRECSDTDLRLLWDANSKLITEVLMDLRAGGRQSFVATGR